MNRGAGLVQRVAEALSICLKSIDLIQFLMSYYQCINILIYQYMDIIYDIENISLIIYSFNHNLHSLQNLHNLPNHLFC